MLCVPIGNYMPDVILLHKSGTVPKKVGISTGTCSYFSELSVPDGLFQFTEPAAGDLLVLAEYLRYDHMALLAL